MPVVRLRDIARDVAEARPYEISLADTIGVASPLDVTERLAATAAAVPVPSFRYDVEVLQAISCSMVMMASEHHLYR